MGQEQGRSLCQRGRKLPSVLACVPGYSTWDPTSPNNALRIIYYSANRLHWSYVLFLVLEATGRQHINHSKAPGQYCRSSYPGRDRAEGPFEDTPLDFIEAKLYTSNQLPLRHLWGVQERPLSRLPNDRDSRLHSLPIVISLAIPTSAFSLLHLIGWNFDFPTTQEQILWRWTCVAMGIVLGVGCFVETASIVLNNYTATGLTNLGGYKLRWPTNLLFWVPAFLYMSARLIVTVEIVISLRRLPAGCFEVVQWSELLPHF